METDGKKGKTRDLYKKVREITGKYTARLDRLRSKGGRHITDSVEIKEGGGNIGKSCIRETER